MGRFRSFSLSSDNTSGVHPKLMEALNKANQGYAAPYCEDEINARVEEQFAELFHRDVKVFLTFNGTGTNVAALSALQKKGSAVVCPACAHINNSESGAPDRLLGMKIIPLPHENGKLRPETLLTVKGSIGNFHAANPDALSISNTTELGTVYSPDELQKLTAVAHDLGLKVHCDGARFANAVAALDCKPDDIAGGAGIDVLCFGGTKNGFMMGEAILFFDTRLADRFKHLRKQYLQLASKGRFIAAQFEAALEGGLWLEMGKNANHMAKMLADGLTNIPGITLRQPVESNQVFLDMPENMRAPLQEIADFLIMDGAARLVVSFDVKEEQVAAFIEKAKSLTK